MNYNFKGSPGNWFYGEYGGVDGQGFFIGSNQYYDGCNYVARINGTTEKHKADAKLISKCPELLKTIIGDNHTLPELLDWVADRLVYVYHEHPNVDFVQELRNRSKKLQSILDEVVHEELPKILSREEKIEFIKIRYLNNENGVYFCNQDGVATYFSHMHNIVFSRKDWEDEIWPKLQQEVK